MMKRKSLECQCNLCDMIKYTTWIRVKDSPPEENIEVLVYTSEKKMYIASLIDSEFDDPFYYLWDISCYEHIIHTQDFSVEYWMPRPKPPKDE